MIYAELDTTFEARVDGFPSGIAGAAGVRILDDQGATALARTTSGITENPAGSGSYIVTLTAPGSDGSYTVFWDTGVVSPSTTATDTLIVNPSGEPPATPDGYTPTVAEVGALIRARTVDSNGVQLGTFTDDTRPTGDEVEVLIGQAAQWMAIRIGDTPADALVGPARNLVSLYAATLIETSYYGEQVEANRSQYPQLKTLYDDGLAALLLARKDLDENGQPGFDEQGSGMPSFSFPPLLGTPSASGSELPDDCTGWIW